MRNSPSVADLQDETYGRDEVAAHLRRARALAIRPGLWTQDAYARDAGGSTVDSKSPEARSFCSSGALFATESSDRVTVEARTVFSRAVGGDLEVWNDTPGRTQAEVVEAFDRAIRLADGPPFQAGSKPALFRLFKAGTRAPRLASDHPVSIGRCRP